MSDPTSRAPLEQTLSSLAHLNMKDDIIDRQEAPEEYGGTCDVFTAWSKKFDKKVAVKRIRVHLQGDETFAKVCVENHRSQSVLTRLMVANLQRNANLGKVAAQERAPASWFHIRGLFAAPEFCF